MFDNIRGVLGKKVFKDVVAKRNISEALFVIVEYKLKIPFVQ